jgi:hypothetical protein
MIFWKGITQGPFHQSLVSSGQVVSEGNIFSNCVRTDDRRKVMTKAHLTLKRGCILFNPDIQPAWPLLLKTEKVDEIVIVFLLNYWANHGFKLC